MANKLLGYGIKHLANKGLGIMPGVRPLYRYAWKNLGPKGVLLVDVDGLKFYIDCRDWAVAPTMIYSHIWEPVETEIFRRCIRKGMNVVDIGAYIGYYAVLASGLVGHTGKVYAFEPSPESVVLLYRNILLNDCRNVDVYEEAVAERVGCADFSIDTSNPSGNSISFGIHRTELIRVQVTTLDDAFGDERIDFIKMDVEGHEVHAINGMAGVIQNSPQLKMIVEAHPEALKKAGSSLEEYVAQLNEHFRLYIIGKDGMTGQVGIKAIRRVVGQSGVVNLFCSRGGV